MRHFVDDDDGYAAWLADHPDAFVINTGRRPAAADLMLHRASCGTISGMPARGSTFTGEYSKVCGDREELEAFARQLGGQARPCGVCLRQSFRPDGGRYGPLRDYLAHLEADEARMAFCQVEELVGPLPGSARQHRPWWANSASIQARAWHDAGWHVETVDQAAQLVVFARGIVAEGRSSISPAARPPSPYVDARVAADVAAKAEGLGLDAGKLRQLITELNENYERGSAYAAHALLRAILDHIPPLLDCPSSLPWPAVTPGAAPTRITRGSCRNSGSRPTTPCTGRYPAIRTGLSSMTCRQEGGSTACCKNARPDIR